MFDGHGGNEAADYAATHLHMNMVRDQTFDLDPALAMKRAYKVTDTHFLEKSKREVGWFLKLYVYFDFSIVTTIMLFNTNI